MHEKQDLIKEWGGVTAVDRKAVVGSIRGHVRYATERRVKYSKEHEGNLDPVILEALDSRQKAAEIVLQILGEGLVEPEPESKK